MNSVKIIIIFHLLFKIRPNVLNLITIRVGIKKFQVLTVIKNDKLFGIVVILKGISSYCHFSRDNIEKTLQYYICKLKKEGTLRQEGGKWLFVFGPRKNNGDSIKTYSGDSFKAFTLDDRLNVIPLKEIKMSFCTG